jgi:hypothetical protein
MLFVSGTSCSLALDRKAREGLMDLLKPFTAPELNNTGSE